MGNDFRFEDGSWTDDQWRSLIETLIDQGLLSWKDVVKLTIGHLNPSQVGTSLASGEGFKQRYGKGNTMGEVMKWFYAQGGQCIDCGSRVELQADHIVPKEIIRDTGIRLAKTGGQNPAEKRRMFEVAIRTELDRTGDLGKVTGAFIKELAAEAVGVLGNGLSGNKLSDQLSYVADRLDNMCTRCRRCNVIRRPSHQFGGTTHLTAESALMWILFSFKPRTLRDYVRMCRLYGMTMADIRMQEGWAMAYWLQHANGITYEMDSDDHPCSILLWADNAITRSWQSDPTSEEATVLYADQLPTMELCIIAAEPIAGGQLVTAFRIPVSDLPFSHYFNGSDQPPQALAITYSAPKRSGEDGDGPIIRPMPPRNMYLVAHKVVEQTCDIRVSVSKNHVAQSRRMKSGSKRAKLLDFDGELGELTGTITVESSESESPVELLL